MNRHIRIHNLGRYSNPQNGTVISPLGLAPCIAGGGKGHDTDKPKILIEYNAYTTLTISSHPLTTHSH